MTRWLLWRGRKRQSLETTCRGHDMTTTMKARATMMSVLYSRYRIPFLGGHVMLL